MSSVTERWIFTQLGQRTWTSPEEVSVSAQENSPRYSSGLDGQGREDGMATQNTVRIHPDVRRVT